MNKFIGVLWKFRVVDFFKFIKRELERIDLSIELVHQLLRISGLVKLQYFIIELNAFFFLLSFLFLFYVSFVRGLFSDVFPHQILRVHNNIVIINKSYVSSCSLIIFNDIFDWFLKSFAFYSCILVWLFWFYSLKIIQKRIWSFIVVLWSK